MTCPSIINPSSSRLRSVYPGRGTKDACTTRWDGNGWGMSFNCCAVNKIETYWIKRLERRKNYLSKKRSNLKNEHNQIKDIPKLFYQSKSFFRAFKLEGYGFQLENVHVPAELLGVFNGEWLGAAMVVSWTTDVMHLSIRSFNISLRAFDCRPCSGGWVIWTLPRCGGEFGSEVSSLSIGIRACFIFLYESSHSRADGSEEKTNKV